MRGNFRLPVFSSSCAFRGGEIPPADGENRWDRRRFSRPDRPFRRGNPGFPGSRERRFFHSPPAETSGLWKETVPFFRDFSADALSVRVSPPGTSDARSFRARFCPVPIFGFPAGFSGGFPQVSGRFFRGRGGNPGFRRAAGAVFRWFCVLRGWKALVFHRSFPLIVEKSAVFFAPFFRPDFGFGCRCGKMWGSQPVSLVD